MGAALPPAQTTMTPAEKDKTLVHQDSNVSSLEIPEAYKIFLGTFRLEDSQGFEDFMKKLGVSPFWLLSDGVTKPVTVISYVVQLKQFKIETRTALKRTELVFKVNEEFVEITADGRRATSLITVGGPVMTHIQRGEKAASRVDVDTQVTRTFNKEGMKCEVRITTPGSQATCVRHYKRIDDDYQDNCL